MQAVDTHLGGTDAVCEWRNGQTFSFLGAEQEIEWSTSTGLPAGHL